MMICSPKNLKILSHVECSYLIDLYKERIKKKVKFPLEELQLVSNKANLTLRVYFDNLIYPNVKLTQDNADST
jgi:hypothetical protein